MAYLYFDTTDHLVLGLLNEKFEWLDYLESSSKKNSSTIHAQVFEMLEKHSLKVAELDGVFQVSGPGSYTGIRLSEGISQIFEWHKMKIYSFYHFEVPFLLGEKSGVWFSKAFKGEMFLYSVTDGQESKKLIPEEEFEQMDLTALGNCYTHYLAEKQENVQETGRIIHSSAPNLFSVVMEKGLRREPYYYRALEQEFKVSQV